MAKDMAGRISDLLCSQDMTQKDLALAANITESAVSHYLKGDRVPRGANLVKVSKALGVTTDYLLGQDDAHCKDGDLKIVKTLIARNASQMTKEEKMELLSILISWE